MNTIIFNNPIYRIENGNILDAQGYKAGGLHVGLRYAKKDLGIIVSDCEANAAAVYTRSFVQAAPIHVTKESIAKSGKIKAIIANSACANACTGEKGLQDAYEMRRVTAMKIGVPEHLVAVASTGVIGEYLDMEKIKSGIKTIDYTGDTEGASGFASAILTTDTVMKECAYSTNIEGKQVVVGGTAKGSGMIHPNMATMLGFLTTDAQVSADHLHLALTEAVDHTFNQITVDGDTSTNDMVILVANGQSGTGELTPDHPEWGTFIALVTAACEDLAKKIARDGEGATKLIEVLVKGAASVDDARALAKTIVGSNLVKTAVYGKDANWGRIIAAMGRSGVAFNPDTVDIHIGDIAMLRHGSPVSFREEEALTYLENNTVLITASLNEGDWEGRAWGCDLTYDYVKINASYRT
ncbi:MAG: bifunctional ornithine acetyltransferase/N-acetylglutamate synthase [Bacillus sp. (in: firmicutes)]